MIYTRRIIIEGEVATLRFSGVGLLVEYVQDQFNGQGCTMYLKNNYVLPSPLNECLCLPRTVNICPGEEIS